MADRIYRLPYEKMIEDALRQVMREALIVTERQGLPGIHHFYITFRTRYPGVVIARHLLERHPDEMTIVLQNQFWGLEVGERDFAVSLSFNRVDEQLRVPFAAVTGFTDPTAKFGLHFNVDSGIEHPLTLTDSGDDLSDKLAGIHLNTSDTRHKENIPRPVLAREAPQRSAEGEGDVGNVITLDAFRKK
ncbi:MAG: hypothetical protein FD149_1631 [Rhodospirillaceae bacterium]|nr:MAG: hypothetical protein FD149_1631 [Rhodospirillaceae bacterium]